MTTPSPVPSSAPAPKPAAYSPAMVKRMRIFKSARDIVMIAIGISLIVYYVKEPKPAFLGTRHQVVDSSVSQYAELVGIFLTIIFGFGLIAHLALKAGKPWPRKRRWRFSVIGLLLGAYLIVAAMTENGHLGLRTDDTTTMQKGSCHYLDNQHFYSKWVACDLLAKWPDGSTSVVKAVPVDSTIDEQTVTVVRPAFTPWPFAGDEHKFQPEDLLGLLGLGVPMTLQALVSMSVLMVGGSRQRRQQRIDALPPGELPV